MASGQAALSAYRGYGRGMDTVSARNANYSTLFAFWLGTWRTDPTVRSWRSSEPALYRNTHQRWRDASQIVATYAQFVYPGPLPKDGRPLADGSLGAIPLDPQVTGPSADSENERVLDAFAMMLNIWQYSQYKGLRPKMAAIFGDCLTELIDDLERGVVQPSTIDPRYVKDIELSAVGDVKAYTLEYPVSIEASTAYDRNIKAESYLFRKEVDGEAFRFFKDGKPFDYSGQGVVIPNPYGFAPAVWDRHEIVAGEDRGISALQKTLYPNMYLNSFLSHASDFAEKKFAAPIGVIGGPVTRRGQGLTLPGGITVANPTPEQLEESVRAAAENLNLIPMQVGGEFLSIDFDLGRSKEIIDIWIDSLQSENPESRIQQQLMEMSQLTAPGVERGMTPTVGLIESARDNADPQTVKLLQMSTAIMGERLKQADYPAQLVAARPDRYDPFAGFDLESYGQGKLECGIKPRPVFQESKDEQMTSLILLSQVIETGDPWLMAQAGVPEAEVARIVGEQEKRRSEQVAAFSVAGAGGDQGGNEPGEQGVA